MDGKRRLTLPAALLREAGIDAAHELIAHVEGRGRVVLQDPQVVLANFQVAVAEGKRQRGMSISLDTSLLADRAVDLSVRTS